MQMVCFIICISRSIARYRNENTVLKFIAVITGINYNCFVPSSLNKFKFSIRYLAHCFEILIQLLRNIWLLPGTIDCPL
jgi:hypothetical protein